MPSPQNPPRYLTDPEELKALAHPLRQRILARLRGHGPATSADLASHFGEDRGATSYHLRQLAKHGYLEIDQQRSAGRRKYWRAIAQDLRLPEPHEVAEPARSAAAVIERQWLEDSLNKLAQHWRERGADPDWDAASMMSTGTYRLTPEELRQFAEEYIAFVKRWRRPPEDAPPEAQPVTALFMAFRTPEDER